MVAARDEHLVGVALPDGERVVDDDDGLLRPEHDVEALIDEQVESSLAMTRSCISPYVPSGSISDAISHAYRRAPIVYT